MEFEEAYNILIDSVDFTKENKNQLFEALSFIKKDMKQRAELEILIHAFLKTGLKAIEGEANDVDYGFFAAVNLFSEKLIEIEEEQDGI